MGSIEAKVEIIRNGEVLEEDVAYGNTKRAAMAAGHALGSSIASDYESAHYVVKVGAISEMREVT